MHAPRTRRRFVPVVLLVFVLALVPALSAQALPLDFALKAGGLWSRVVSAFAQAWAEAGSHIDPNGAPTEAGSQIDPNGAPTEEGSHIDPDGSPTEAGSSINPDG